MATGVTVQEQLPGILSVSPSRVDRQLRALKADGLIPASKQGRGSGVHFSSLHLAYILMAQAAQTPAEAPEAVRTLRGMLHRGTDNPNADVLPPLQTFEDYLVHMIEGFGVARLNNSTFFPDSLAKILGISVQLCLLPAHAMFRLPYGDNGEEATALYAGDPTPKPALHHLTVLHGPALLAFGNLWADSEIQRNAQEALAQLRDTPAKAPSESNNAGSLRQEVLPASSFDDQPLAKGTSVCTDAEGICGDQGIQACGVARAGHQTELTLV